jgi:hypothetical protein
MTGNFFEGWRPTWWQRAIAWAALVVLVCGVIAACYGVGCLVTYIFNAAVRASVGAA